MKHLFTSLLIVLSISTFAQTKAEMPNRTASQATPVKVESPQQAKTEEPQQGNTAVNPRTAVSSARSNTAPADSYTPPYDVNDKYMGRKAEFLGSMTIKELPADFPVYDKQWSVKDYNEVVDAYFMKHTDILKEHVKQKIEYHINKQQAK